MTKYDQNELSDRQKKALPHFAEARSYTMACKRAGVSKNTFYEWMKNPSFKRALRELQGDIISEAYSAIKSATIRASQALIDLLEDKNPQVVRGVANDILGHTLKFLEQEEVLMRIERIEETMNKREGK